MGSGGVARTRCFPPAFHAAAKPCDYCKSAAALLFCRVESAFMCMSCDSKVHNNVPPLKHERVWMCEVCEQAPAAVTCKADAAALCVTCDNDIHCANPLARRHERSPVLPFYDTAESMLLIKSSTAAAFPAPIGNPGDKLDNFVSQNSYITDSWVSDNPIAATKFLDNNRFVKPMEFLFSDSDPFLNYDSFEIPSQPCSDSVVPVQTTTKAPVTAHLADKSPEIQFDIDFRKSSIISYNNSYNNPSLSRSISSSTMEVGVVPDGSETSYPTARTMSSVDLSGNQSSQVVDMDREARVLRYREKKKNRKFEKTIRYASRKAYAETRPRIKGRFVKRTDSEPDINRFFGPGSGDFIMDARYGVVPSF
ncbi:zinc finger protein CONSTANS-LIKE 5-like [Dorcoceras hygrometricum]|uniref:Zinc finger protein CONSTANS-LIKE 5-like n=1 Tax=Dorcoceras hygrometricum TaxID=472368 RepID=A0A2Z7BVV1_9LAMI|nr:zinc finger protein CONSTANS-LIKE 5-like [Dorcoceras hygrometricum]